MFFFVLVRFALIVKSTCKSLTIKIYLLMTPYHEFYSDLDIVMRTIEKMIDDCNTHWVSDVDFYAEIDSEYWYTLRERLEEILDQLNNEPFFTNSND